MYSSYLSAQTVWISQVCTSGHWSFTPFLEKRPKAQLGCAGSGGNTPQILCLSLTLKLFSTTFSVCLHSLSCWKINILLYFAASVLYFVPSQALRDVLPRGVPTAWCCHHCISQCVLLNSDILTASLASPAVSWFIKAAGVACWVSFLVRKVELLWPWLIFFLINKRVRHPRG